MSSFSDCATDPFAPQQARSRDTVARLNAATLALLNEQGLRGCTVPAVSARAGLAVGTVYRRYPDKDHMIADAVLSLFTAFDTEADVAMSKIVADCVSLEGLLRDLALTTCRMVTANKGLLRAVRDFAENTSHAAFVEQYTIRRALPRAKLVQAILHRFEDQLAGGETALRIALAALLGAIHVTYLEPMPGLFGEGPDPERFSDALARMQDGFLRPAFRGEAWSAVES